MKINVFHNNDMHWILSRCFPLALLLLLLLCRPSTELTQQDVIDVNNRPVCNKIIEVDNKNETLHILRSQNGNCTGASNQTKCMVTYRGTTDFIRNAYVLCGYFDKVTLFDCETTIQMGQSIHSESDSKIITCNTFSRSLKYCSPPTKDLQVVLESESTNTCAKDAFQGYVQIRLDYAYPDTFRFDTEDECPWFPQTLYDKNRTIMSQFQPGWDVPQNRCEIELHPIFNAYECVEFCIEFVDHKFVSGGAGLKIAIGKWFDSMIFNSSKEIPTGQICKRWHVTTPIKVIIVPGKDPVKKHQHAVLFHYSFNIKDDDYCDERKGNGFNSYQYVFIFLGIIIQSILTYYCRKKWRKSKRTDNETPVEQPAEPGSVPSVPTRLGDPPSYPSIFQSNYEYSNFELEGRAWSSSIDQPSSLGPAFQDPPPPEYSNLFPGKKY